MDGYDGEFWTLNNALFIIPALFLEEILFLVLYFVCKGSLNASLKTEKSGIFQFLE